MEHARTFPAAPASVPEVRRWAAPFFERDGVTDDALLAVSELVTNAVQHGSGPVRVRIVTGDLLRIEVGDARPVDRLAAKDPDPDRSRGRGLFLVEALADAWGYDVTSEGGKVVWAEFGTKVGSGSQGRTADGRGTA